MQPGNQLPNMPTLLTCDWLMDSTDTADFSKQRERIAEQFAGQSTW